MRDVILSAPTVKDVARRADIRLTIADKLRIWWNAENGTAILRHRAMQAVAAGQALRRQRRMRGKNRKPAGNGWLKR